MNSRENMQNTAGMAADTEPAELPDLLKEMLAEAYPDPKGKIAAGVMAQIRAQRAETERAERTERRRRRQGLIMKWGGMAACMVILSGALVIASPLMNRADGQAMNDQSMNAQNMEAQAINDQTTEEAAAADADNGAAYGYSFAMTDEAGTEAYSDEEEAVETAAKTRVAPRKKQMETEPAVEEGAPVLFALTDNTAAAEEKNMADTTDNAAFLQSLFDRGLLTPSVYEDWMTEQGYDDPDDWTETELCTAFGIEN